MLKLENNGNPEILLENTANGKIWEISAGGNFLVREEGGSNLMKLAPTGLLTVAGTQGGPQNVLALENAGNPEIILKNTATNNTWEISAGNNFLFRKEGGANLMTLSNSGAMTIAGPITTGASSRAEKAACR